MLVLCGCDVRLYVEIDGGQCCTIKLGICMWGTDFAKESLPNSEDKVQNTPLRKIREDRFKIVRVSSVLSLFPFYLLAVTVKVTHVLWCAHSWTDSL